MSTPPPAASGLDCITLKKMDNFIRKIKNYLVEKLLFFNFFQRIIGKRWFKRWEDKYILAEKELSLLPIMMPSNPVIFDIGANRGELGYFFANICKADTVYSFEPQNRMFGVLLGVAENTKNIKPFNIAFSNSNGEKTLKIPIQSNHQYTQAASLEETCVVDYKKEIVKIKTLDSFVNENKIDKLDFIKCDTEGHELLVFEGAKKTITSLRPLIYVEIKDTNLKKMFELFKETNYKAYTYNNYTNKIVPFTEAPKTKTENYYFVPIEKEQQFLVSIR